MSVARCGSYVVAMLLALCVSASAMGTDAPWQPARDGLQPIPALAGRVNDTTGTLAANERQALEAKLAQWETATGNQLVVLIVATTRPESIEEYSLRVAEAWKIGHKGSDNGALFLVAKNDKKMRIEVGYGLEGSLTDVTARRIIGDVVAPLFTQGQFAAGINAGVDQIIKVVGGAEPAAAPQPAKRQSSGGGFDLGTLFVLLLVVVPIVGSILRSMLGTALGSLAGAGIAGAAAWFVAGSLLIAGVAAVVAFVVILFSIFGGRGGGGFIPIGGGGGGFSSRGGGGGFSGGGGSFGGGGASGGWN